MMSSTSVELGLLGFLRMRPMHGYEIHQLLADREALDGLWRIKLSRLYAMLARLEAQDYISAQTEPQGDRPPRKVFSLTQAGAAAFDAWVTSPVDQPRDMRLAFMLKLYFARLESPEAARRLVAEQQHICAEWLAGPLVASGGAESSGYRAAVCRFRRGQIQAIGEWLAWAAADLAKETQ